MRVRGVEMHLDHEGSISRCAASDELHRFSRVVVVGVTFESVGHIVAGIIARHKVAHPV